MLIQTYVSVKTHYQWQEKQISASQTAMLLTDWLKEKIHAAGNFGCNHQSKLIFDASAPAYLSKAIWVLPDSSVFLPKAVRKNMVKGSEALWITSLAFPLNPILESQTFSEVISVSFASDLKPGDPVISSDCHHGVFTYVNSLSPSHKHISLQKTLYHEFKFNAVIGLLEKNIIYLRKTSSGSALYVSDGKRSESLDDDVIGFKVSKQKKDNNSLLHIQIIRQKLSNINFYASILGE